MPSSFFFFFFNDTATTEIYTLSLHDALPISRRTGNRRPRGVEERAVMNVRVLMESGRSRLRCRDFFSTERGKDRKSTRLNSSHVEISYAVFCLKKKKKKKKKNKRIRTKYESE